MRAFAKKQKIKRELHNFCDGDAIDKYPDIVLDLGINIIQNKWICTVCIFMSFIKVSKFQNELMKSLFLPKYEQKIVRISAL